MISNFIDGSWHETGRLFDNINPATGRVISQVHEAGQEEVDLAVRAAKKALRGPWGQMSEPERLAILHRIADIIDRRTEDFVSAEVSNVGMPEYFARSVNIPRGADNFRFFANSVHNVPEESFRMRAHDGSDVVNYSSRSPRGVIAIICPWNLPLLLTTWKMAPALACGNTIVIKPSEETPSSAALLAEVMEEAGVPKGVVNVVQGFGAGSTGAFLTENPDVDGITFTGETQTGEVIMRAAAKGLRPVSFELGGKNPAIIFADADLDKAVSCVGRSAFQNSGQVCLGTERVFVERSIFDDFVARLKGVAESMLIGSPLGKKVTLGPLISREHHEKVLDYYAKARELGANIITGGGVPEMPSELVNGNWIQPTIWTGLPDDCIVNREEIFGPCCHITPFDSFDEVIDRANATSYGLAATVWTRDISVANRAAAQLDVGICWVNSWFLRDLRTAFGGAKNSGIGREGGIHGLEFYTELKNICVNF